MRLSFPQHLLVVPVRPFEMMTEKIRRMASPVLVVCHLAFGDGLARFRATIGTMV